MSTVSRPTTARQTSPSSRATGPRRSGRCALTLRINATTYTLRLIAPDGFTAAHKARLTKPDGTRYVVAFTPGEWAHCDCPDSQTRPETTCKHIAALEALGIMPRITSPEAV
ncbi:MAG: hypothetical protein M3Q75_14540 [Gemmatimonadota bacterium]|nr:hypothetical protein [Gemmatimonadota bacterium]